MAQPICSSPVTSKIKVKNYPKFSIDHTACSPVEGQFRRLTFWRRNYFFNFSTPCI